MSFPLARVAAAATGAALLAAPGLDAPLRAQPVTQSNAARDNQPGEVGTVRGRVVEGGSQRPLAEAQVQIVGTTVGAITNANGE